MTKSKILKSVAMLVLLGLSIFLIKYFYKPNSHKPDLTVVGFVNLADGLGRHSVELLEAFQEEFNVNFVPTRIKKRDIGSKDFQKRFMKNSAEWGKVIVFEDQIWTPYTNQYKKITKCKPDSIKFAYSMWESTKIPYEWGMILNQYFDAVLVPSHFLIEVYKNSGVTIPVFELPLGLNMENLFAQPLKQKCGYPMVFGNLSACSDRKNHIALIRAFAKAFGNSPDVQLRINSRQGETEIKEAVNREIKKLDYNNIIFSRLSLPKDQYLSTFLGIDCYVSPSKGEGFSIQPREAMALGIPVIATNNTGQEEVCKSGLVKIVESPIRKPAFYPWGNYYGHNFDCSVDDLANALKEMKESYDFYISKANEAREWAKQYQYENVNLLYRSIISPKSVVLGDKNEITKDGLITDSKALYEKYQKAFGSSSKTL